MEERDVHPAAQAGEPDPGGDDEVVGHRFLTPDQAQARAERARSQQERESLNDVPAPERAGDQS